MASPCRAAFLLRKFCPQSCTPTTHLGGEGQADSDRENEGPAAGSGVNVRSPGAVCLAGRLPANTCRTCAHKLRITCLHKTAQGSFSLP
jgi:hypothetical protein